VSKAFEPLLKAQLIRKQAVMGWNEFAAAAPAPATPAKGKPGAAPKLAPAAAKGKSAAPAAPTPVQTGVPFSTSTESSLVNLRLGVAATERPVANLRLGGKAAEPSAGPATAPWKLKPVLDAIAATAGGGIPGQLIVYKVFLQLPPELLKRAGVQSITSVTDQFTVTDARLREAIIAAAQKHAKLDVTGLTAA
jgi:hypothetical protein